MPGRARALAPAPPRAVTARISVLLCSTQPLLRAGLRASLERQPDIRVVGDPRADAGGDGTAELALGWQRPDVVVVDAHGPTGADADSVRRIRSVPGVAAQVVAVIEPGAEIGHMVTLLRAGAQGLLFRDDPAPAGAGDPCGGRRAGAMRRRDPAPARLLPGHARAATAAGGRRPGRAQPREREIFGLVARGLSNAEIAGHLLISERTVEFHVSNLLAKLDLRDRVQAAVLAGTIAG